MARAHFIERDGRFEQIVGTSDEWESGFWSVSLEAASRLVGGRIYFHKRKAERSFFGGDVLSYRVQPDGEFAGRVIFRFRFLKDAKNVSAGGDGWGFEKKLVL